MSKATIAVLCGGRGRRLRPDTLKVPKPLVEIEGKPILDYIVEMYIRKGFNRFILCTGYKSEMIEEHFRQKNLGQCDISFSNSGTDASMLKRIHDTYDKFNKKIIVTYGDTLTDIDMDQLLMDHDTSLMPASIVTTKIRSPFGLINYGARGNIESFDEKPILHYYIGHTILNKKAFSHMTDDLLNLPDGDGLVAYFKKMISLDLLNGYEHDGFQLTFNTHKGLKEAAEQLKGFYTLSEELSNEDPK